jgi:hypothetical protein
MEDWMDPLAPLATALAEVTACVATLTGQATVHGALIATLLADASPGTLAKADAALAKLEAADPSETTEAASAARRAIKGFVAD